MQIIFKGKSSIIKAHQNMFEVVNGVLTRVGLPKNTSIKIDELTFKVIVMVDGEERVFTVPREMNGETVDELLTIQVELGEDGEIVNSINNEEESLFQDHEVEAMLGLDHEYGRIESPYVADDLEMLDSKFVDDITIGVYKIKASGLYLVRYYLNDDLICEKEMLPEFWEEYSKAKEEE